MNNFIDIALVCMVSVMGFITIFPILYIAAIIIWIKIKNNIVKLWNHLFHNPEFQLGGKND